MSEGAADQQDYGDELGGQTPSEGGRGGANSTLYNNNHDLIGVEGIVRTQQNEIEKKKVSLTAASPLTHTTTA